MPDNEVEFSQESYTVSEPADRRRFCTLALAGKPMTVLGFILPVEATRQFTPFILTRHSPQGPFCPSGAPKVEEGLSFRLDGAAIT